jgi:hypothetical protein
MSDFLKPKWGMSVPQGKKSIVVQASGTPGVAEREAFLLDFKRLCQKHNLAYHTIKVGKTKAATAKKKATKKAATKK